MHFNKNLFSKYLNQNFEFLYLKYLLPKKIILAAQNNKNVAAQKNNFAAQSNRFAAHFTNSQN